MAVDINKLNFYSGDPIDKVITTGTATIVNDGATTNSQTAKILALNVTNTYGEQAFIRYVWSIDGVNYNSSLTHLLYTFNFTDTSVFPPVVSTAVKGLQAAVSAGVGATNIRFITGNGYHGDVIYDGVNYTYTPTSLTFTIKYAVFSIA